ncbi:MAG: YncE family protein [Ignavibacteriae bacterium]|nr:YncE family protein [Ignavibacteria bacterium]MBI3364702.1 YncE family protein [Ignavibacteriota bacterium]
MKTHLITLRVIVFILLAPFSASPQSTASGYHIIDSLKLEGEGGWDYLTVDTSSERVYISRSSRVQVVDIGKHSLVGEIPNTIGVHGIALVPSLGKGYTSNGRDSSVTVFDLATLKTLRTIKIDARNPDAILFDPSSHRVFTFNGGSSNATAIDVGSDSIAGTVPLPGKPEAGVTDDNGTVFVNIEDKSVLVVFDSRTLKVLHTWPLAPGEEPSGLAIDKEHRRLFSGCGNRTMAIVDTDSGTVVTTVPIGNGVDGTAYDPASSFAFSTNGEGTLSVVREDTPTKFSVVENAATRRGARTIALDEKTHRIYTVSAKFGPPPAPTADRPHPRPAIEPGSVTLYTIGR